MLGGILTSGSCDSGLKPRKAVALLCAGLDMPVLSGLG